MKYVTVDDLQAYCDNQTDHSITPNDFQRMNYLDIIRCRECHYHGFCSVEELHNNPDFFCADGKKRMEEYEDPAFI